MGKMMLILLMPIVTHTLSNFGNLPIFDNKPIRSQNLELTNILAWQLLATNQSASYSIVYKHEGQLIGRFLKLQIVPIHLFSYPTKSADVPVK
jgi:hypothetical protein